jgi:imidazolonepropionase-like amidohydrolase
VADLLIRNVRLRATGDEAQTLSIRAGKIASIAPTSAAAVHGPATGNVLEGDGRWLLAGLIDAHCHLCYDYPRRIRDPRDTVIGAVAAGNAAAKLACGVTTVRDLGAMAQRNLSLVRDIDEGRVIGPRVSAAGDIISAVDGHMGHYSRQVAGVDDIRAAVREQARAGAEWIKLMVSGGVATTDERWDDVQLSEAEVAAAVDEAHTHGLPVAAHAHPSRAITVAARAGCDTIEHATELDEQAIDALAENECSIVPTMSVYARIIADPTTPGVIRDQTREIWERKIPLLRRAHEAGIRIGIGTDSGGSFPASDICTELRLLSDEIGLTNTEVIGAATSGNAAILGKAESLGKVEVGYEGDFILVGADPYTDLSALARVEVVVRAGKVVGEGIAAVLGNQ